MDIKKIKFKDIQYALGKGKVLRYTPSLFDKARGKEDRTYTIEGALGQGGFGITYLASSTFKIGNVSQKLLFTIKEFFVKEQCWRDAGGVQMMLPKAKSAQDMVLKWLEEFVTEADRLNRVCKDMPHVVNVNEVFRANGTAYYVMEFLDGGSLKDMIASQKGLSEPEALSIILPIARTLAVLHKNHHIIHCDIKDDNIMMRKNEEDGTLFPVLIDFGESRHFNSDGSFTSKRNTVGGTPGYAPLEQAAGDITVQVDVYALAATLFCALTGNPPQVASSVTSDYIKSKLPENTSASVKEAIIHAMQTNKHSRTATMADFVQELLNGIAPPSKPDELPIGYILNGFGAYYRIASQGIKRADTIQYKAVRFTKKEDALSSPTGTVRAQIDIYEFFVDGCHHRDDDMSVSADCDTSAAWQQYIKLCREKTGNNIAHEFQTFKGEGWATFEANNTYYLAWTKIRKPLPWRKIITYSVAGISSLLLIWGAIGFVQGFNAAKERERQEMSQRLTEAIVSNDEDILREFAVEHDSIRAYLPYAKLCLDHNDFDSAEKYANDSLMPIIQQKKDSLAFATHGATDEQIFDSLFNAAKLQFDNKQFTSADNIISNMGREYRSRQQVKDLLGKIRVATDSVSSEARFDSLYNAAKSQYDNKQYKVAQSTLAKMNGEYLSRPKVKDLSQAIEKALTPTDGEIFQQALRDGNWTVIENLGNKGYSKAYYQLAQRYFNRKNFANAKKWANKAINARVNVAESRAIINKIIEEENYSSGSKLYQQWVISGDSLTREKAIQSLQKANQNNTLVINMLNVLKEERQSNSILRIK